MPERTDAHAGGEHSARPGRGVLARAVATVATLALLVWLPAMVDPYTVHMLILTALAAVLAMSYRLLLVGGLASLCHGTFYGLGAYAFAIMTTKAGAPLIVGILAAIAVAAVAAALVGIPALRTAGAYFFLMTFAFYVVMQSLTQNFDSLTNGFAGIVGVGAPESLVDEVDWYYAALGLAVVSFAALYAVDRARWGLELRAVGAREDLAKAVGINMYLSLLLALVAGAAIAGVGGAMYASYTQAINPTSFGLWVSLAPLLYVMIGGPRYLIGSVLGAIYVTLVPLLSDWSAPMNAMFAALTLLLVIMLAPRGLYTTAVDAVRARVAGHDGAASAKESALAPAPAPVKADAPGTDAPPPSRNGAALLEAEGLRRSFDGVTAVNDVSLTISHGQIVGLVGPNGSGKSTIFNLLTGFLRPDEGSIVFAGEDITHAKPHRIARKGIARAFQSSVVFEDLTVYENVLVAVCAQRPANPLRRALLPVRARTGDTARARAVIDMVGLHEHAGVQAGSLPYGLKKALGVTVALATEPRLLAVDEPAAGMTEAETEALTAIIRRIRERGVSVIITEHRVSMIEALCDHVVALHDGRMIAEGTPAQVFADPLVQEAFLGQKHVEESVAVRD
ncbi:MAG: ATP-binding cassette domain-containing protein [Streptosporangiales bacterium]|nr:ATP-binding cassette domain-containing protein [Streptosporangiales bacterium]